MKFKLGKPVFDMDFIEGADNVYRTEFFIVKQIVSLCSNDVGDAVLMSTDTFYARTVERDKQYEILFGDKGKDMDGYRIHSAMYTRKYID